MPLSSPPDVSTISLKLGAGRFEFVSVQLLFDPGNISNVFRFKNNKTVGETLEHPRYEHLGETFTNDVRPLDRPLGEFLHELKLKGSLFYKVFLNPYGDEVYCSFKIADPFLSGPGGNSSVGLGNPGV